ncbi:MAG: hypothetical protein UIM25_04040, partial [Bacteroidales bacterium]|nr:hypothetical protein [Bacteroidales bacterium]
YLIDQALTANEAIDSFTKLASYASFEENIKGEMKVGMLCDFVVLDECIESCNQSRFLGCRFDGRCNLFDWKAQGSVGFSISSRQTRSHIDNMG